MVGIVFVLIQNIFTQIETTLLPVKNCKCCPLLSAEGLWAGKDVSRVMAAKTSGTPKDRPFDHPLRLAWWRLILTRISKGANRLMSGFLHLQRSDCALVSQNKLYISFLQMTWSTSLYIVLNTTMIKWIQYFRNFVSQGLLNFFLKIIKLRCFYQGNLFIVNSIPR